MIRTYSNKQIDLFNLQPGDITIEDIAKGLSHQPRWMGQTKKFYSVAHHSMLLSSMMSDKYKLAALLHDASEAYICDLPGPIKHMLPDYQKLEKLITESIMKEFNVDLNLPILKAFDKLLANLEKEDIESNQEIYYDDQYNLSIKADAVDIETMFLATYRELIKIK